MAVFDLLRSRITKQVGVKRSAREDLALAMASLAFGTAPGNERRRNRHPPYTPVSTIRSARTAPVLLAAFQ